MPRRLEALLLLALLLLPACGSEEDRSVAPVLSDLTYTPTTVTAGALATITGSVVFSDPDEDASEFAVKAASPIGQSTTVGPKPARGSPGRTDGQLSFGVHLDPQVAGTYMLEIWMVDEAGNESNRLRGDIEAL